MSHSAPTTGTGESSGQSRPAPSEHERRQDRGGDEAARGLQHDRVGVAGDGPGDEHEEGEEDGDEERQERRGADGHEARLDDHQRADEADDAGGEAVRADLLAGEAVRAAG